MYYCAEKRRERSPLRLQKIKSVVDEAGENIDARNHQVAELGSSIAPAPIEKGIPAARRGDDGHKFKVRLEGVRTLPKHVGKECAVSIGLDLDQARTGTFVRNFRIRSLSRPPNQMK